MQLSNYVVKTSYNSEKVLYNTVTKEFVPESSTESILQEKLFLAGQEQNAVEKALLGKKDSLQLTIVPTWECNLRCSHCSVLTLLKKKDPDDIDENQLFAFIAGYLKEFNPEFMVLTFLGGEPLLRTEKCLRITKTIKDMTSSKNVKLVPNLTTNLTLDLTDAMLDLFDYCFEIGISVDGNKEQHNWQRKPLDPDSIDPYDRTMHNLKELVEYGFAEKIRVKAAMREWFLTPEYYGTFLQTMTDIGIPVERVTYARIHPTDHHHSLSDKENYSDYITKRVQPVQYPCCKYRIHSEFWVQPNGDIFDVGFGYARHRLGHISDELQHIIDERKKFVFNEFPCFKDPVCATCPVIGYCWGGCVNAATLVKDRPSQFCNQQGLIAHITEQVIQGTLVARDANKSFHTMLEDCYEQLTDDVK